MKIIMLIILSFVGQTWANSPDDLNRLNDKRPSTQSVIIKAKSNISVQGLGFSRSVVSRKPIVKQMQIYRLDLNPVLSIERVLADLQNHPQIAYAQLNHKVTMRTSEVVEVIVDEELSPAVPLVEPDDTHFSQQWSMKFNKNIYGIDAQAAWSNYGIGGKDIHSNEIVVAVVDGGVQSDHPDLQENAWINEAETPGNGIDDDNNGYIDDITGWNSGANSGAQVSSDHGTHVAGTIGARGNNSLQVVGVNWDVKIMDLPVSFNNTDVVLGAYNYILQQKKLWLATDGAQGANIVATNSSFGIDGADCQSGRFPAWNDIYNEMGKVGILSAAATMNSASNVDVVGDVPTGCSSPYIIAVTNSNSAGKRFWAAYGKKSIDLAAPGDQIISTVVGGRVRKLSGTSMATPHVAGAVAFLNSVASVDLLDLYKNKPGEAALEMKRMILETVTKVPGSDWEQETVAGGILNLNQAAEAVAHFELPALPEPPQDEEEIANP